MSHKEDLENKLFMEDAKSVAMMLSDFFQEKRVPTNVASMACMIMLTVICDDNGVPTEDVKKMMDILITGFPDVKTIKAGKNNNK